MRKIFMVVALMTTMMTSVQAKNLTVTCKNQLNTIRTDEPVVVSLKGLNAVSAIVTADGKEIPCQVDDFNSDGKMDELCFVADFGKKETRIFKVETSETAAMKSYPARVYAEMLLNNPKEKGKRQTSYISALTVDGDVNPYNLLQHHGPAFESELVGYRIYFDKRQTVDIYGKYKKGLEIKQTQFYPTKEELASGYGDDCLWVGNTLGAGTLRGWDGMAPQMLDKVAHRTERIIARGPIRTIVEVQDDEWQTYNKDKKAVNTVTRYTLYAGHRDVEVKVSFTENADDYTFCSGVINVKNSTEYSNKEGLRGCWGTDWPVSEKDSAGHKRETVGLAVYFNKQNFRKELSSDKDNYPLLVSPVGTELKYHIAFCSDNESFGFHSDKDWYKWMQAWKKNIDSPINIKVEE